MAILSKSQMNIAGGGRRKARKARGTRISGQTPKLLEDLFGAYHFNKGVVITPDFVGNGSRMKFEDMVASYSYTATDDLWQ